MTDTVQQSIETMLQLRELVREAHGVIKDLRLAIKEAKQIGSDLPDKVKDYLGQAVSDGLTEYASTLELAIKNADDAVTKRFDMLAAIYLDEDPMSIAEGKETIYDIVARKKHIR